MDIRIILFLVLSTAVCRAQSNDFNWLIGKWQLQGKQTFETWSRSPGGDLMGKSFKVSGQDTTMLEQITIQQREGTYFYVPDVAGDQKAIPFKIVHFSETGFTAENPDHDFPKLIRYAYMQKDGFEILNASIEGDGKVIPYNFTKVD